MERLVVVSARRGRLYVSSWWKAQRSFLQGDWTEVVDEQVQDAELGGLIRAAFAECRDGVPFPDFRAGPTPELRKLLELADVKTFAAFARGTRQVEILLKDSSPAISVIPSRNGGARSGFTMMNDKTITVDRQSADAALGAAVRRALSVATS